MIPADQLKRYVAEVVEAARKGGYPAALHTYKRIVTQQGMDTADAVIFGMAIHIGLQDAGIRIEEPK